MYRVNIIAVYYAKVPVYGKVPNLFFNSVKFLETVFNTGEIDFELEVHLCSELSHLKHAIIILIGSRSSCVVIIYSA